MANAGNANDFDLSGIVVIDNGSALTKAGYAGELFPKSVFASVVGRDKNTCTIGSTGLDKEYYIGDEAVSKRNSLSLNYPIRRGIITDWKDTEAIWHDTIYNELGYYPDQSCVLLSESATNPKENRMKTTEIMFEKFHVEGFYLAKQAVLSMYAAGKRTGLVIESGDGITQIVPMYEGCDFRHGIQTLNVAGKDIQDFLVKMVTEKGHSFNTFSDLEFARDIKEKLGYVALDYEKELELSAAGKIADRVYQLPDGTSFTLGSERFKSTEALFKPSLIGLDSLGIHQLALTAVTNCDADIQEELLSNVVFGGGNTFFPGLKERMEKEFLGMGREIKIAEELKKHSAWVGGSVLASLSTFAQMIISKEEYEEIGSIIVERKCF